MTNRSPDLIWPGKNQREPVSIDFNFSTFGLCLWEKNEKLFHNRFTKMPNTTSFRCRTLTIIKHPRHLYGAIIINHFDPFWLQNSHFFSNWSNFDTFSFFSQLPILTTSPCIFSIPIHPHHYNPQLTRQIPPLLHNSPIISP